MANNYYYSVWLLSLFGVVLLVWADYDGGEAQFLQQVPLGAILQYAQILSSTNNTKAQILANLQSWAAQYNVTSQFNNFTGGEQQLQQQFYNVISGNLSGQALQLFNQLQSIAQDSRITRPQECQQIAAARRNSTRVLRRLVPIPQSSLIGSPPIDCFFNNAMPEVDIVFGDNGNNGPYPNY